MPPMTPPPLPELNPAPSDPRLAQQLQFILEIDRLKSVLRQNVLVDGSRRENSAEHSWHLAIMALVLAEYADEPVDRLKLVKMLLAHDLVEVYAGDTYCYDPQAAVGKQEREADAARRLFGLLPEDVGGELHTIWEEFEAGESPEARFADAMDRLQPVMLNFFSKGVSWSSHGVTLEQVMRRNCVIEKGSAKLWEYARTLIEEARVRGYVR